MTGKPAWQRKKLFIFLTRYLCSLQLVGLLSPSPFCYDRKYLFNLECYWYHKKHYCNNPVLWHYWDIWILRLFLGLLILLFFLCCPSQSDLFSGSGCMWDANCPAVRSTAKTSRSHKTCGSCILTQNHPSFQEPLTWNITALLCFSSYLGRGRPQWRTWGASRTSHICHLTRGAEESVDVAEFKNTAVAFDVGLLYGDIFWSYLFICSAKLALSVGSESVMLPP